jgi:hypothetical protein
MSSVSLIHTLRNPENEEDLVGAALEAATRIEKLETFLREVKDTTGSLSLRVSIEQVLAF